MIDLKKRSSIVYPVIALLILIGIVFIPKLFTQSSSIPSDIVPTPTPKIANLGPFSVTLPDGWRYEPQTGVDSFVGTFIGDGVTLLFDYGFYSNSLARDGDPKYNITYEQIDGRTAKIVRSKISNQGLTGVFFADVQPETAMASDSAMPLKNMLGINGENIPAELVEKVIGIYRSIKFKK